MWTKVIGIVVFIACIWTTGGLKCFQCLDYNTGGTCTHDYEGLVNASKGLHENGSRTYYKECPANASGLTLDKCVIEVFYVGGQLKSFIRDCSDGANFSFTGDVNTPKLNQIVADNFTTCVYRISANAHICVTLCQEDFCNGPLPPNETSTNDTCDATGDNATCGAGQLLAASGPFGPIVDHVFSRGYLMPLLAAVLCVMILG